MVVLQKIILGITLAAPIGPVSIEMIKRGLQQGFWAAFNIRLGGAIGNILCLLAAFYGLSALQAHTGIFMALGLLGSGLLLYMGYTTLRKASNHFVPSKAKTEEIKHPHPLCNSLALGFMLAIFNPVAVMFWLGIFANSVSPQETLEFRHLMLNMQIITGVLIWGAFLSLMLEFGRQGLTPRLTRWITVGSGLVLLAFGFKYGYQNLMQIQHYWFMG